MKKTILLSLIALNLSVYAQLNNSFYLNTGSWTANSNYSIKLAKNLGAKGAGNSVKILWRDVQDSLTTIPSLWTWGAFDNTIQALQNDTLDIYANILCVGPKKINPNSCNTSYSPSGPNGGQSWFPEDTIKWKQYIYAMIDRYDGDSINDMPGLKYPVNKWRIETEWQSFWCSLNSDTSLTVAQEFTRFVNMTANVIKTKQPTFTVSFAGMDPIHDRTVFYDGYTAPEPSYCRSDCNGNNLIQNQTQMSADVNFQAKRRNMIYILRNCIVDEIDIHQYGRWKYIPNTIQWYKDSAYTGTKSINFLEGSGPFCSLCDSIYHIGTDTDGRLPASLVRNNSSYVVYWYIMGLSEKVKLLSWYRLTPNYNVSTAFGDPCLLSMNYVKKPSYYTYRFLAKTIFSNPNADSVVKIAESNPNLYHYQVQQLPTYAPFIDVAWSTNPVDSIVVSGTGTLYTWDIPITCNSLYPTACDSVFPKNTFSVSISHTIALNNGVPVFYSWGDVSTGINQIVNSELQCSIYPNPNNGSFWVTLNQNFSKAKILVTNVLGKNIFETTIANSKTTIDLGEQSNGIYFITINSEAGSLVRKIIINK